MEVRRKPLAFSCELPAGEECNPLVGLNLDALGSSGNGYKQKFDNSIPLPDFMSLLNPPLFGGSSTQANVGFVITNTEKFLLVRIERFPNKGTYFFQNIRMSLFKVSSSPNVFINWSFHDRLRA